MKEFKNQMEMYKYIWDTRDHVSQLSGKPLLLWKLNPENIILGLPEEHENQNNYAVFNAKHDELKREYYKEFYNKEF
jgi:hypothetical protein